MAQAAVDEAGGGGVGEGVAASAAAPRPQTIYPTIYRTSPEPPSPVPADLTIDLPPPRPTSPAVYLRNHLPPPPTPPGPNLEAMPAPVVPLFGAARRVSASNPSTNLTPARPRSRPQRARVAALSATQSSPPQLDTAIPPIGQPQSVRLPCWPLPAPLDRPELAFTIIEQIDGLLHCLFGLAAPGA